MHPMYDSFDDDNEFLGESPADSRRSVLKMGVDLKSDEGRSVDAIVEYLDLAIRDCLHIGYEILEIHLHFDDLPDVVEDTNGGSPRIAWSGTAIIVFEVPEDSPMMRRSIEDAILDSEVSDSQEVCFDISFSIGGL